MPVKKTASLKVAASLHIASGLVSLHPNDGFDLGLMTKSHEVEWCTGILPQDFLDGKRGQVLSVKMQLLNDCPHQTLRMNMHQWKNMGSPEQVVMLLDGCRMFMIPVKSLKKDDDL